jgi:hypothetical protein
MNTAENITAQAIADRWERVRQCFGNKANAWVMLMRIAAAGEAGLPQSLLRGESEHLRKTIYNWSKAGLIEIRPTPSKQDRGPPARCLFITEKALKLLRVSA